jgi:hypothetical protein
VIRIGQMVVTEVVIIYTTFFLRPRNTVMTASVS